MNDNVPTSSPHHVECLRLLNDLHDLLGWAEKMGITINSDKPEFTYAMDFGFWREQIAQVLLVNPSLAKAG